MEVDSTDVQSSQWCCTNTVDAVCFRYASCPVLRMTYESCPVVHGHLRFATTYQSNDKGSDVLSAILLSGVWEVHRFFCLVTQERKLGDLHEVPFCTCFFFDRKWLTRKASVLQQVCATTEKAIWSALFWMLLKSFKALSRRSTVQCKRNWLYFSIYQAALSA